MVVAANTNARTVRKLIGLTGVMLISIGLSAREPSKQGSAGQTARPTYDSSTGPVIAIDEAHKNTTTYARYPELIKLLQDDGYRPRPLTQSISAASLADVGILVANDPQTSLSEDEVAAVLAWLKDGGSLLLVLDHYASAQTKLTTSLGVRNWPGNAVGVPTDLCKRGAETRGCAAEGSAAINVLFWRSESFPGGEPKLAVLGSGGGQGYQSADAVLARHAITEGRASDERIRRVATFSGSAFEAFPGGVPLLTLPPGAGPLFAGTPVPGWLQGAVTELGKGRVAIFADSGVMSGATAADKGQFIDNRQFVLNVMHWLTRAL